MYFGADYYPEHWPKERWAVDAKLMKEAGFNLIRVAEFAWAKLEPAEEMCIRDSHGMHGKSQAPSH